MDNSRHHVNQSVIGHTENLGWMSLNILTLKVISKSCCDLKRSNIKVIQISSCNISKERYGRDKYFGNILGQYIHPLSQKCRPKCICNINSVQSDFYGGWYTRE